MDKNYNVDDILSEIKKRKSNQKGQTGAVSRPTVPAEPRIEHNPKVDFSPEPEIQEQLEDLTRAFAPVTPEQIDEEEQPVKVAPLRFEEDEPDISGFAPAQIVEDPPKPPETRERQTGGNRLGFDGEVQSLADRAKSRRRSAIPSQRPPVRKLDFQMKGEESPAEGIGAEGGLNFDHTRVLRNTDENPEATRAMPSSVTGFTSTGRELNLDEIRKLDFGSLRGEEAYYDDDEDDVAVEGLSGNVDFSEYNSADDRKEVSLDIANTKLWLFIRAAATLVFTAILLYFTLSAKYESYYMLDIIQPAGETMRAYLVACTVITAVIAIVNSSTIGGGLISLFRMKANSDTMASLAVLASVAQGIVCIANPDLVDGPALNLYFIVAAFAMLFNALGKMSLINRIQQNFRLISSNRPKRAVLAVESDSFCHAFVKDTSRRKPTIAYNVKTGFLTDFLALSYSDKYDVGANRAIAPFCLLGAFIIGISTYFLSESMISAVSAFTAILCVCATFSATFIENIPLGKLAKKLVPAGAMVSGNKAVEDFCDTRAIILTDSDLFPQGHVSLQGIKAFSRGRIDEAILDTASVLCALDGALSPVFLDMIGGDRKLLKKVDGITFEDGMGVAAWIDSRRVLIGNRQLMRNHGIPLPNDSYEQGNAPDAIGEPVYVSNSGEVSARFLVAYTIDEELATQLDMMGDRGKQLLVYTSDANVNEDMIWDLYAYPRDLITIVPASHHDELKEMTTPKDNAIGEIAYIGRASAMITALMECISARTSILAATVIQFVQMIVGYGFVAFLAFMGTIGTLSIVQLLIYQFIWFAIIFVLQQVRQS